MTEKFAPPVVTIRRYAAPRVCDVVVVVRGQEMVIRCPSYSHALKWAQLERKSYKIPGGGLSQSALTRSSLMRNCNAQLVDRSLNRHQADAGG
jgi:hypothetical protein